MLDKLEDIRN